MWVHLTYFDSFHNPVGVDEWVVVASFMGEVIDPYDAYMTEFMIRDDVNKKGVERTGKNYIF